MSNLTYPCQGPPCSTGKASSHTHFHSWYSLGQMAVNNNMNQSGSTYLSNGPMRHVVNPANKHEQSLKDEEASSHIYSAPPTEQIGVIPSIVTAGFGFKNRISMNNPDMYSVPTVQELALRNDGFVKNLIVGHKIHGHVQFLGLLNNISGLNLSEAVKFTKGKVTISSNTLECVPMLITLHNVTRADFLANSGINKPTLSDEDLNQIIAKFKKDTNAKFVLFVEEVSMWHFLINPVTKSQDDAQ